MNRVEFTCVFKFAQFCAELTRQGIAFKGAETSAGFAVTLTGY